MSRLAEQRHDTHEGTHRVRVKQAEVALAQVRLVEPHFGQIGSEGVTAVLCRRRVCGTCRVAAITASESQEGQERHAMPGGANVHEPRPQAVVGLSPLAATLAMVATKSNAATTVTAARQVVSESAAGRQDGQRMGQAMTAPAVAYLGPGLRARGRHSRGRGACERAERR